MPLLLCLSLLVNSYRFDEIFSLMRRSFVPQVKMESGEYDCLPIRSGCCGVDERNNLYFARLTLRMIDQNDSVHILHPYLAAWTGISAIAVRVKSDVYAFNRFEHHFLKIGPREKVVSLMKIEEIRDVFSFVYNPVDQYFYATGEWWEPERNFQAFFLIKLKFETKTYEKILFISDVNQYLTLFANIDNYGYIYVLSDSNWLWKYSPNGIFQQGKNLISQVDPNTDVSAIGIIMDHYLLISSSGKTPGKVNKYLELYDSRTLKLLAFITFPSDLIFHSTNRGRLIYFENRDRTLAQKRGGKWCDIIDTYSVNARLIESLK